MTDISIYIFGSGGAGEHLLDFIKADVNVLGFLDNNPAKWHCECGGLPILPPTTLKTGDFDRVLVCSAYHEEIVAQLKTDYGLQDEHIINTHALFHNHYLRSRMEEFAKCAKQTERLVLGISYAMLGVIESKMSVPTFNFAMNGQDLYYDFAIFKHVAHKWNLKNLRHVLINLTAYSLHYDLSRRKNDMVTRYSSVLGDYHNAMDTERRVERALEVIDAGYSDSIYEAQHSIYADYFLKIHRDANFTPIKNKHWAKEKMERISMKEHGKFFPETVKENVQVLNDFAAAVRAKGFTPVFFTVPGHPNYSAKIPRGIEEEFHSTIAGISSAHDAPFFDMLRSSEFDDRHYYDDSHLNEAGAILFTTMLDAFVNSV